MKVKLLEHPTKADWLEVSRRALVTAGKEPISQPSEEWCKSILKARHSPIRRLRFSFYIECPYWVSVHLCRHIHAQPYVKSQRNDRQTQYDREFAPQNTPVQMIWDMNAEELLTIANKRLCNTAATKTHELVSMMCTAVSRANPEFTSELVPMCVRQGGVCYEMKSCGKAVEYYENMSHLT